MQVKANVCCEQTRTFEFMPTVIKWVSYPFTQEAKFTLHVTKAVKDGAVCIPVGLGCPLITAQLSS